MQCSLSGEICSEPVVSKKSGRVFEKRLILQHLQNHDYDPSFEAQDQKLEASDLIEIAAKPPPVAPRSSSSIPGLLKAFQNEWDSLILENSDLRTQLNSVRQELAHALYQHEAACRVISRLMKERDEARNMLSNSQNITQFSSQNKVQQQKTSKTEDVMEEVPKAQLPSEVLNAISTKAKGLSSSRKQMLKDKTSQAPSATEIKNFTESNSFNLHKSTNPGIMSLSLNPAEPNMVASGGEDTKVLVFNLDTKKIANTISDHSKKVNVVKFHSKDILVSGSADGKALVFKKAKAWKKVGNPVVHDKGVTGCALLPDSNDYWITGGLDSTWKLNNLMTGNTITTQNLEGPSHTLSLHPDGVLLVCGQANKSAVYDLRSLSQVATFAPHTGNVNSISCSPGGLYIATSADEDKLFKIWDLRNSSAPVSSLQMSGVVSAIEFDGSAQYLAAGAGNEIRIFAAKNNYEQLSVLTGHAKRVTTLTFGENAQALLSGSLDRSMKVWSASN